MEKHVTAVAIIKIGLSILWILIGIITFIVLISVAFASGDEEAKPILIIVGSSVAAFLILISIPGIIGGIGLLRKRSWARILVLILAVIDLFNIPIGTAIGIYSIWALIQDETVKLFTPAAS